MKTRPATPDSCHVLEVQFNNTPAALQRFLLAFSRRRIQILDLKVEDAGDGSAADMHLRFVLEETEQRGCSSLEILLAQLQRLVEVVRIAEVTNDHDQGRAAA